MVEESFNTKGSGLSPEWVVGFVDGEGCFNSSPILNVKARWCIQTQPEFVVVQHEKDKELLERIGVFFTDPREKTVMVNREDKTSTRFNYKAKDLKELLKPNGVCALFTKYPLQTKKAIEFVQFKKVCAILNREGFKMTQSQESLKLVDVIEGAYESFKIRYTQPSDKKKKTTGTATRQRTLQHLQRLEKIRDELAAENKLGDKEAETLKWLQVKQELCKHLQACQPKKEKSQKKKEDVELNQ